MNTFDIRYSYNWNRANNLMYTKNGILIDAKTKWKLMEMGYSIEDIFGVD